MLPLVLVAGLVAVGVAIGAAVCAVGTAGAADTVAICNPPHKINTAQRRAALVVVFTALLTRSGLCGMLKAAPAETD